jgi:plasmid stabilization system protein ParE
MIRYRFLWPAEEEMSEAALFYEAVSPALGSDFLDDVQRAIDILCDYPQAGEPVDLDFRRTLLHRFRFSLIYALEDTGIVIIAVAHHGREPDYWHGRVH